MNGVLGHLCADNYRLNLSRGTSWGWWDEWDDTVLQTDDSKFICWVVSHETWEIDPILFYYWSTVYYVEPTLKEHYSIQRLFFFDKNKTYLCLRPWATGTLRSPPPPQLTHNNFFKPLYVQNTKWYVNTRTIGTKFICRPLIWRYPQTCLKLG